MSPKTNSPSPHRICFMPAPTGSHRRLSASVPACSGPRRAGLPRSRVRPPRECAGWADGGDRGGGGRQALHRPGSSSPRCSARPSVALRNPLRSVPDCGPWTMPPTVCAWTDHGSRCREAPRVGELLRGTLKLALEKSSIIQYFSCGGGFYHPVYQGGGVAYQVVPPP